MRWYPASFHRPKTAFTFDLLETYHKIALQGKLNLYDFYHAIMQKSDNQGRSKPVVSFWIMMTRVSLLIHFLRSTVITKFPAASVNGAISRVSNAGAVLTWHNLSPQRQRQDPLPLSAPRVHTLNGIFQKTGTVPLLPSKWTPR